MAWAIFHAPFRFDRRPKKAVCLEIEASDHPQCLPHDVIEAAVTAGKAKKIKTPSRSSASRKPNPVPERKTR